MKWVYRIFRTIVVSLLFLAVGIPIFLYLVLWFSPVQEKIRAVAQTELSELLGADVAIRTLDYRPFTRLKLSDISIVERGDTLLKAEALNAGVSGRNLFRGRIVITGVELMRPDVRLRRDSVGAPLNIQPVIDRLKGDGSKPPKSFNFAVQSVVIRRGSARYDVDNISAKADVFDVNHLSVSHLNADITAPEINNGHVLVSIKRLSAREKSGLYLRNFATTAEMADSVLSIRDLLLKLGGSELTFADMDINLRGHDVTTIELKSGSALYPEDFTAFHPGISTLPGPVNIAAVVNVMTDSLVVKKFDLSTPQRSLYFNTRGAASKIAANASAMNLGVDGGELAATLGAFTEVKSSVSQLLTNLGKISFTGSAAWRKPRNVSLNGLLESEMGIIDVDAKLENQQLVGALEAENLDLGKLLPGKELGTASFGSAFSLARHGGRCSLSADHIYWRGHDYQGIDIRADYSGKEYAAIVEAQDSLLSCEVELALNLSPGDYSATITGDIAALNPEAMGLTKKFADYVLSGQVKGEFAGEELLRPTGQLMVSNLRLLNPEGEGLREAPIALTSDFTSDVQSIRLRSDLIDADISGQISLPAIKPTVNNLLVSALPQYFEFQEIDTLYANDFTLKAVVKNDAPLLRFLALPIELLYPATLNMAINTEAATVNLSAPYLRKGNSLISSSALDARLGADSRIDIASTIPGKFGDIAVGINGDLSGGIGNLTLRFDNEESPRFAGDIKLRVKPLAEGFDAAVVASELTLGGVGWNVEPAYLGMRNNSLIVHGFGLNRAGQELTINGVASKNDDDRLIVKLDNINVDYIFRTLQMAETLQFGGDATGTVTASALFSGEPILQTENLYVKGLKYGGCVMGNANIRSRWNNETRGIELYADVDDPTRNGSTQVDGKIFIVDKKLDFLFTANHSPAGFLHTFMKTWASDVGGTASGKLHLFGGFKSVDLEGEAVAENFSLSIGYTGVTYYATDTIRIRPGNIAMNNIIVRDKTGRTGVLNGNLNHTYFKEANFKFLITDLDRMLVLDTHPTPENDRWYGTIRANGSAEISGVPGLVTIKANALSAPGSDFTFALTNAQSAAQYNFLTFRDVTPLKITDFNALQPGSPELDKQMRAQVARGKEEEFSSNFKIELHVDVNPSARMNLVMDPAAGDKIAGTGSGHLDLTYGSDTDEMRLYGDYKIDKGEYNFSLQDIILKTFTIRDGSEISFHGDPMEATLNISAYNQVNANLSDLDESFLNDKEVQRTVVPVWAVLNVNGSMQDPQISFDIDLPTLTSDVKRKVKSIISTDDMMNRQIIYLLALNRFYTPEYMAATKGNDLMSVASGTLSSQLSNILGQLSDKISIAPSLRTETEDFSDMEVDVALSGTLLNNRLLLNGNFGYRDNALNNNQFIGDFDVEYLLTRRGNWRLKAYNHFNDRNLYVKQALTTQGLGLVFKHDFDRLFRSRGK